MKTCHKAWRHTQSYRFSHQHNDLELWRNGRTWRKEKHKNTTRTSEPSHRQQAELKPWSRETAKLLTADVYCRVEESRPYLRMKLQNSSQTKSARCSGHTQSSWHIFSFSASGWNKTTRDASVCNRNIVFIRESTSQLQASIYREEKSYKTNP